MKEITRISLAALPFNIEIEAKKQLETYLKQITASLHADADAMKEIEARIVELLAERKVTGETVISGADITKIMQQLGDPKEFIDEEEIAQASEKTAKKLMRDMHNRMLGGVCAGIAAYIKLDVVWVRLIFATLSILTSGFGVVIYIIMWIITPPARTSADRLQMRGEPVTLAAIQSETMPEPTKNPLLARLIRALAGLATAVASLGAFAVTAMATHAVLQAPSTEQQYAWPILIPFMIAGILCGIFFAIISVMFFKAKINKTLLVTLGVLVVAGISSAATGAILANQNSIRQLNEHRENTKNTTIKLPDLAGKKQLTIDVPESMRVEYIASDNRQPEVTMTYNKKFSQQPIVLLSDSVLKIHSNCAKPFCDTWSQITIYGPQLDNLTLQKGSLSLTTFAPMTLTAQKNTTIDVQTEKAIDKIQVITAQDSRINLSNISVKEVAGTVADSSSLSVGNVKQLNLQVPTGCATNSTATVSAASADDTTFNGARVDKNYSSPCVTYITGTR